MGFPVIDMELTGKNIKRLCQKNGITVKKLQKYLHLTCTQTVYRWFEGRSLPSIDNLLALSRLFGIPIEGILVEHFDTGVYGKICDTSCFIDGDRRILSYKIKMQELSGRAVRQKQSVFRCTDQ